MLERLLGAFPQVIQLLRDDHKKLRLLFAKYDKTSNSEKPQLAHRIIRDLILHATLEERVIYPAFRAAFKNPRMIYEAIEEHHLAQLLLDELNSFRPGPGSATFDAKFKVLREVVKRHVNQEEGRLFPKAEAHDVDWKSLYEKAQKIKEQVATKKKRRQAGPKSPAHLRLDRPYKEARVSKNAGKRMSQTYSAEEFPDVADTKAS